MVSPAKWKAIKKYDSEKVDNIRLRVPKGKKELIQECAQANGESVNGMINRLLDQEIQKMNEKKDHK